MKKSFRHEATPSESHQRSPAAFAHTMFVIASTCGGNAMALMDRRNRSGRRPIKTSCVRFNHLRQLQLDLNFQEEKMNRGWRFELADADAILLYRRYVLHGYVSMPDLLSKSMQLDWRGLMSAEAFDDALKTKSPT
jgi:hypothetical protein